VKKIKGKLTLANLTACLALFVALGGVSYAATQLPKNSIGAKQIKKGAVGPGKLSPSAKQTLTGATGPQGNVGPRGPQGDRGPKGDQGVPGVSDVVTRYGPDRELPTSASTVSYATCKPGESVIAGGWSFIGGGGRPATTAYYLILDRPSIEIPNPGPPFFPPPNDGEAATGWLVGFENNTGSSFEFRSYVQCSQP
jgi:hypothetical protein